MTALLPLLAKEWRFQLRTHKLLVSSLLFVLVGLASPLLAALLPTLMANLPQDQMGAVEIMVTREPELREGLNQYLKNFNMLPLLVVLANMGAVAGERQAGTLPLILANPVSRGSYLLAKLLVPAGVYLAGTILSGAACFFYCTVIWGEVHLPTFVAMHGLLYLYLMVYLCLTLLGSVVMKQVSTAAGFGLAAFLVGSIVGSLPSLARFTPTGLFTAAADLANGRVTAGIGATVVACVIFVGVLQLLSTHLFRRQAL